MLASGSVQQTPKIAHYASASSAVQSRLVRVVGEIIGLSLSASHQAAAQGGRSPFEAGSSDPEITKGYTYATYTHTM